MTATTHSPPQRRRAGPTWVPQWAKLRPPRGRLSYRNPLLSAVGLVFVWCLWAGWATIVVMALVFWWLVLGVYWCYRYLALGTLAAARGGVRAGWWGAARMADRRG